MSASRKEIAEGTAVQGRSPAPQSVDRIFGVIDHLAAESRGDTLAGIARRVNAPKTSMVGLLAGMLEGGYVVRDDAGRYGLGPRMMALAARVTSGADLGTLARPILIELVAKTGETALLGALAPENDVAMYVEKVESLNPVRYTVSLGERRELYSAAIGKLLLAYMDAAPREAYLRAVDFKAFTPKTITSARELRSELDRIRREGISRTDSERVVGASALAVPVLDPHGRLVVGITLAGPSERMRRNRSAFERQLREAAQALGHLVAGRSRALDS